MTSENIPEYLNKNVMFNRRVQIGRKECFDIVLTRGPRIYVVKDKQVSGECDLSTTFVKDIECKQTDFNSVSQESFKLYDFDICFSYAGKLKQVFLLLKMRDKLIVMTKRSDQITVHKEYENVRLFKVFEEHLVVHLRIEMTDGLSVCDDLYRLTTDSPVLDQERFGGVANTIATRIASTKAELSTTKLDVRKYFHVLTKKLRFGPYTLHDVRILFFPLLLCCCFKNSFVSFQSFEERVMLAKFGDTWIKRHNDMLVLGVPVYNCCYIR